MAGNYFSLYDTVVKYEIKARCREPLHIGSGEREYGEVLIHPVLNRPFVQSTGIAGAMRAWFADNTRLAEELFGSAARDNGAGEDSAGRLRFTDGFFEEAGIYTELRPRVKIDRASGTVQSNELLGGLSSGQKFQTEAVASGSVFRFELYLFEKEERFEEPVEKALKALHAGMIQLGGQKSNGCGYVSLLSVKKAVYHMREQEDRRLWAGEEKMPEDITEELLTGADSLNGRLCVTLTGRTAGALLVKSISTREYGEGVPDAVNLQNRKDEFIIPASSLKGVVRSRIERIAAFRGLGPDTAEAMFGAASGKETEARAGLVRFYDCAVGEAVENAGVPQQMRIHIDKLTGGVFQQQLFGERPVCGKVALRAELEAAENGPEERLKVQAALLLMAFRDIGMGLLPIGSGSSIGRGYIEGERLRVSRGGRVLAEMDLAAGRLLSGEAVVKEYMEALNRAAAGSLAAGVPGQKGGTRE